MKIVIITSEARRAVMAKSTNPYVETETQLPSGDWQVPIKNETWNIIHRLNLQGETISDTIIRIMSGRPN